MTDDAQAASVARRDLLKGLAAGLPMVAATISLARAATPAPARFAAPDLPRKDAVPLSDRQLLEAFVRLLGSTDGSITAGWLDSQRYAVVDGEAYPLCRVLAGASSRFERKSETLF